MFRNPDEAEIATLLTRMRVIAVVGLSPNPARPSYQVAKAMQSQGYRIIPVRPAVQEVLGEKAYATLRDVPEAVLRQIDVVDVFRNPEQVMPVVEDCLALNLPTLWLQDGVVNESAALRAQAGGMQVVMNRCVWRDYMRLRIEPPAG